MTEEEVMSSMTDGPGRDATLADRQGTARSGRRPRGDSGPPRGGSVVSGSRVKIS